VLTAAAADQEAAERDGHGLFTYAVLDALRKGDRNGNGFIELSELVAHVQDLVPKLAAGAKMTGGGERGLAVSAVPKRDEQSARFGSRGEDFVLAGRLQQR
jgi:uncharacterized caspase-like protein